MVREGTGHCDGAIALVRGHDTSIMGSKKPAIVWKTIEKGFKYAKTIYSCARGG